MKTSIPEELRKLEQFVCWKREVGKKGKPTKVPYNAGTNEKASSTDPTTWCSFEKALEAMQNGRGYTASASCSVNPICLLESILIIAS